MENKELRASYDPPKQCPKCDSREVIYTSIIMSNNQLQFRATCLSCGWWQNISKLENLEKRQNSKLSIWARKVKENDNNACHICGKKIGVNAHHIIPVANDPQREFMYEESNGIAVCDDCHSMIHYGHKVLNNRGDKR